MYSWGIQSVLSAVPAPPAPPVISRIVTFALKTQYVFSIIGFMMIFLAEIKSKIITKVIIIKEKDLHI
jgi:hypothetical protein